MNKALLLLLVYWIAFAFLHSVFATDRFKMIMQKSLKSRFIYYRFLYSLFSVISLTAVVYYHFSIHSILLWQPHVAEKIASVCTGITGLAIMFVCSRTYFGEMMGLYAFTNQNEHIGLVQTGLHKYVRHPLYTGTLLFMWAFFIWQPSLKNIITCGINTLYVLIGIRLEERKLVNSFGDKYRKYASKTPMLIPWFK